VAPRHTPVFLLLLCPLLHPLAQHHLDVSEWPPCCPTREAVPAFGTELAAVNRSHVLGIGTRQGVSINEPRPTTWLTYNSITTPMAAGPMIDVFDITHVPLCDGDVLSERPIPRPGGADRSDWTNTDLPQTIPYCQCTNTQTLRESPSLCSDRDNIAEPSARNPLFHPDVWRRNCYFVNASLAFTMIGPC